MAVDDGGDDDILFVLTSLLTVRDRSIWPYRVNNTLHCHERCMCLPICTTPEAMYSNLLSVCLSVSVEISLNVEVFKSVYAEYYVLDLAD